MAARRDAFDRSARLVRLGLLCVRALRRSDESGARVEPYGDQTAPFRSGCLSRASVSSLPGAGSTAEAASGHGARLGTGRQFLRVRRDLRCTNGVTTIIRRTLVPDLMWREGHGAINGAPTFPSNVAKAPRPRRGAHLGRRGWIERCALTIVACCAISAVSSGMRLRCHGARKNLDRPHDWLPQHHISPNSLMRLSPVPSYLREALGDSVSSAHRETTGELMLSSDVTFKKRAPQGGLGATELVLTSAERSRNLGTRCAWRCGIESTAISAHS